MDSYLTVKLWKPGGCSSRFRWGTPPCQGCTSRGGLRSSEWTSPHWCSSTWASRPRCSTYLVERERRSQTAVDPAESPHTSRRAASGRMKSICSVLGQALLRIRWFIWSPHRNAGQRWAIDRLRLQAFWSTWGSIRKLGRNGLTSSYCTSRPASLACQIRLLASILGSSPESLFESPIRSRPPDSYHSLLTFALASPATPLRPRLLYKDGFQNSWWCQPSIHHPCSYSRTSSWALLVSSTGPRIWYCKPAFQRRLGWLRTGSKVELGASNRVGAHASLYEEESTKVFWFDRLHITIWNYKITKRSRTKGDRYIMGW